VESWPSRRPRQIAANTVSQATAQAVNLNLLQGALKVALSNPATSASNDGTQSNAQVHAQPIIDALSHQRLLEVGALAETAEANQDGSSYGCAGIVGRGGQIQIGEHGKTCTPIGAPNGGVTIDLGALPGADPLGGLLSGLNGVLGVPTIKITVDALTAHGYEKGTDPAILGATVVNVHVHLGHLDIPGAHRLGPEPGSAQRCAGCPLADPRKAGRAGQQAAHRLGRADHELPAGRHWRCRSTRDQGSSRQGGGRPGSLGVCAAHLAAERLAGGGRPGQGHSGAERGDR